MTPEERLLTRLTTLGRILEHSGETLGLLSLGSVGAEKSRMDAFSDLDFFVIVRDGFKRRFIDQIDWLEAAHPVVFHFINSPDGRKVLFADGIYAEFAIFETRELAGADYAEGAWVWRSAELSENLRFPQKPLPERIYHDVNWMLGEITTCIYVGLCRFHRGEKFTAMVFVERHAVNMLVKLWQQTFPPVSGIFEDAWTPERRFEQRYPEQSLLLPEFLQGYGKTTASARAIVRYLEQHYPVNAALKAEILRLCE